MHLAADVVLPTPRCGRARVRVFEPLDPADRVVVLVSEEPGNGGQSVTNAIYEVVETLLRPRGLSPEQVVVVEHYPTGTRASGGETFDLVVFPSGAGGEPEWKRLDRRSVEKLVGQAV